MIKPKFIIYLVSLLTLILLLSCNKIVQDDNHKGEKALQAIYDPPFYFSCFSFELIPNEVVINDSVSYKALEDSMLVRTFPGCDTAHFVHIDFNTNTLIGKKIGMGVCDSICREIVADTVQKKYIYTIRHKQFVGGICGGAYKISMNWVLVPKLPDGYKVEFDYSEY